MALLRERSVHFQAYNVMGALLAPPNGEGGGHREFSRVGGELAATSAQVLLGWLVQQGISVVPRSASSAHLREKYALANFDFKLQRRPKNSGAKRFVVLL